MAAKSILVVDSSASIRQIVVFTLKNAGYSTTEASDGEAAWNLRSKNFDMIITDLSMPRMDGITMIKKFKELATASSKPMTKIIVLSSETSTEKKNAARTAGATIYMEKPFTPSKLVENVKKTIGN